MNFQELQKKYYDPFLKEYFWILILYAVLCLVVYYLQLIYFPNVVTKSITMFKSKSSSGEKQNLQREQSQKNQKSKNNTKYKNNNARPLFIICLTFIIIILLHFIKNQFDAFLPVRHSQLIRETIFKDTLSSFQTQFKNLSIGIYMSRYNAVPREMRYLSETFMGLWPTLLMILFVTGFLFYYDVFTGLGFLILHVFMMYFMFLSPWGRKCFDLAAERATIQLKTTDEVSQRVMNMDHIFINQQEEEQTHQHHDREEELGQKFYETANHTNQMVAFLSVLSIVAFGWVLYRGYQLSKNKKHAFHETEMFTRLLLTMCFFQNSVLKMYPRLVSLIQGIMTVHVFISSIEMTDKNNNETPTNSTISQPLSTPMLSSIPPLRSFNIEIRNLTFSYPSTSKFILKNWSFSIPEGSRIILQGPSGSGKSTLMKLLIRFYEVEGNYGNNGNDAKYPIMMGGIELNKIPVEELRRHVKYIPQTTHLLDDSMVQNILFGNTVYTEEEVKKIVKQFKLDRVLGNDVYKRCGAEGKNISLGMQKVIVILRGLLQHRTTSIFLMDEPFSGLDEETRESVMDMFESMLSSRHTIIISNHVPLSSRIKKTMNRTIHFQI
uniref:ABC transporter domain-containing protein n=1 Tax=viral metagenome TaxID=1070528 RepID=A0A6C0D092_9ZZZZ